MNKKLYALVALAVAASACGSRGSSSIDQAISKGKPLVRVGDEKINEGYLDLLQKINPGIKAQLENPMGKKRVLDNLIEQELLYQESVKRGVDKLPEVQDKAELYKRVIVAQSLIDTEVDKRAQDYYDKNKDKEFERVKVSQIFVSNQPAMPPPTPGKPPTPPSEEDKKKAEAAAAAKIKEAYEKLQKGESWDEVVKSMSDDKAGAAKGGDMGYLSKGDRRVERMDYQKLIDTAFTLPKGKYSEPIQAKDGWHIIEVTEDKKVQPFDEVSNQIKFKIRGETKNAVMADLKKNYKIQFLDVSLAESAPATPPPMPMGMMPPGAAGTAPAAPPPPGAPKLSIDAKPAESAPAGK